MDYVSRQNKKYGAGILDAKLLNFGSIRVSKQNRSIKVWFATLSELKFKENMSQNFSSLSAMNFFFLFSVKNG